MGVKGLLQILQDVTVDIYLSDIRNQVLAIDGHAWLHKSAFSNSIDFVVNKKFDHVIKYFITNIARLTKNNNKCIIVFDGKSFPLKAFTNKSRRAERTKYKELGMKHYNNNDMHLADNFFKRSIEIDPNCLLYIFNKLKDIFKSNGNITCLISPFEADAQLAYLSINNFANYIITEDSDLILFGAKKILFKFKETKFSYLNTENIYKSNIFKDLKELRKISILSGCDYLENPKGIGIKKNIINLKSYKSVKKLIKYYQNNAFINDNNYYNRYILAYLSFNFQKVYCLKNKNLQYLNDINNNDYTRKINIATKYYGSLNFLGEPIKLLKLHMLVNGIIYPNNYEIYNHKENKSRIKKIKKNLNIASTTSEKKKIEMDNKVTKKIKITDYFGQSSSINLK